MLGGVPIRFYLLHLSGRVLRGARSSAGWMPQGVEAHSEGIKTHSGSRGVWRAKRNRAILLLDLARNSSELREPGQRPKGAGPVFSPAPAIGLISAVQFRTGAGAGERPTRKGCHMPWSVECSRESFCVRDGHERHARRVFCECISAGITATLDRKSTRLNSSHIQKSRMPSSA